MEDIPNPEDVVDGTPDESQTGEPVAQTEEVVAQELVPNPFEMTDDRRSQIRGFQATQAKHVANPKGLERAQIQSDRDAREVEIVLNMAGFHETLKERLGNAYGAVERLKVNPLNHTISVLFVDKTAASECAGNEFGQEIQYATSPKQIIAHSIFFGLPSVLSPGNYTANSEEERYFLEQVRIFFEENYGAVKNLVSVRNCAVIEFTELATQQAVLKASADDMDLFTVANLCICPIYRGLPKKQYHKYSLPPTKDQQKRQQKRKRKLAKQQQQGGNEGNWEGSENYAYGPPADYSGYGPPAGYGPPGRFDPYNPGPPPPGPYYPDPYMSFGYGYGNGYGNGYGPPPQRGRGKKSRKNKKWNRPANAEEAY